MNFAFDTEQEAFWAGEFGDNYMARSAKLEIMASRTAMFARALRRAEKIHSVLELGANIGLNMRALRFLLPGVDLNAIEINATAYAQLREIKGVNAIHGSLLDYESFSSFDLTFTSGVLIHINPERVPDAYDRLYSHSSRYILIAEYYNPTPVEVTYRGHSDRLFKRDWAGEMLSAYRDLKLIDYGFVYHLDPQFPADDVNWFLLERH